MTFEGPSPLCRQMSGNDPRGAILSVLVRSTFDISTTGLCTPADEQVPLTVDPVFVEGHPEILIADTDLFPYKPLTDVVVSGHAYAYGAARTAEVRVRIGDAEKHLRVTGPRTAARMSTGRIVFSTPMHFDRMPLRYDLAYGGVDAITERARGNPYESLRPFVGAELDLGASSPYRYPRNPVGRGFAVAVTDETLEHLALPVFEEPGDVLTPERLAAGVPTRWPAMPLPAGLGWVEHGCFPRSAYLGVVPPHEPMTEAVAEAARGYAPADILSDRPVVEKFSYRFANGASHGLQLPYLQGGEDCEFVGLHPSYEYWRFRLPDRRPRIWTDGRNGAFNETETVLHSVIVEPDANRVGLVWRGAAPALRPYLPQELERMPFRVEW